MIGEPLDSDTEKLRSLLLPLLVERMEQHKGLAIFAKNRSKFEGWLKVEVIDILEGLGYGNVLPEKDRIDVTFDGCAMELKTCDTNYQYDGVRKMIRAITQNVNEIIKDLKVLKGTNYNLKISLFVAFPLEHNYPKWQQHFTKIFPHAKSIIYEEFRFGNVPSVLYLCVV